jgi:hypothetical protein
MKSIEFLASAHSEQKYLAQHEKYYVWYLKKVKLGGIFFSLSHSLEARFILQTTFSRAPPRSG